MATFAENLASDFSIFTDDLSVTISYRKHTGETFNPSTGTLVPVYESSSVTAIQQGLSTRIVAASNGLFTYGDSVFFILASDLDAEPKRTDLIVCGGETYEIRDWTLEEDENVYRIIARQEVR